LPSQTGKNGNSLPTCGTVFGTVFYPDGITMEIGGAFSGTNFAALESLIAQVTVHKARKIPIREAVGRDLQHDLNPLNGSQRLLSK
jgi:hypothetical protein